MFGGAGHGGGHGGGHFAAEALASQSIFTPKDTSAQLAQFQSWAQTNSQALSTQLCTSSANVINAVNGVNDRMFQAFVAQAQAQTAQVNNMQERFPILRLGQAACGMLLREPAGHRQPERAN